MNFYLLGNVVPDCCGSELKTTSSIKTVTRFPPLYTVGPSFYLNKQSIKDISPPNRISDLSTANIDTSIDHNIINISWTAPGGDWNYGRGKIFHTLCNSETSICLHRDIVNELDYL